MASTPQRILNFLKSRDTATAIELSRALSLTVPDIRHHLGIMQSQGLVISTGQRRAAGRGRPSVLYSLNEEALNSSISLLAEAFLEELLERDTDPITLESHLRSVASHLVPSCTQIQEKAMSRRLTEMVRILNEMAYEARWEARSTGPLIYLDHCPYAMLQKCHPVELCQVDRYLLEHLLGSPVVPLTPPGKHHCMFSIK